MRGMNTNGQSLPQFLQNHKELTVQQILHAHLRISTHTVNDNKIRPVTDQESKPLSPHFWTSVTTVTPSIRKVNLAILEFTRAMDSSEDLGGKERCRKKEPVCTCSGILQLLAGDAGLDHDAVQLHGWGYLVRVSIFNVDRIEPLPT